MIREYEVRDKDSIQSLGRFLNGSFDIDKLSENEKILVYENENGIIGFIVFSKLYEVADLTYIVVDPQYRRCGIGKKLLDEICKDSSVERIMLEVRESNENAIEFYKNNGFVILRKINNYYNGEDALSMERSIR